jgi:hypothetical protein
MKGSGYSLTACIVRAATPARLRGYPGMIAIASWGYLAGCYATARGLLDGIGHVIGGDFISFYSIGKLYRLGHTEVFYDFERLYAFQRQVLPELPTVVPFINPPFTALFYAPFGLNSYLQGLTAWWAAGLVALWLSLRLLASRLFPGQPGATARFAGFAATFFPTVLWFSMGQTTTFVLLLLSSAFLLLRQRRDFAAGLVLGMLAFKPQLALPLALPILLKFRHRAIAGGGLSAGFFLALGWWLFPGQMSDYIAESGRFLALFLQPEFPLWSEHALFGFCHLLLKGTPWSFLAPWLTGAASMALLAFAGRIWSLQPWQPAARDWDRCMAASMCLGLCLATHLFTYDLMLLLLPFLIVLASFRSEGGESTLDQGPILATSVLVYLLGCYGAYLSRAQQWILEYLGLPALAIQFSTLAIIGWAVVVFRGRDDSAVSPRRKA